MPSDPTQMTDEHWHRTSSIAVYPGFSSYLQMWGGRMRFIVDAQIECVSEVPKLQEYIKCMSDILALAKPRCRHDDEPQFPDESM